MANKRITIYEKEKEVVITEYNYENAQFKVKVAEIDANGDYNPNKAEDFCKHYNIDADIASVSGNEVSFDVTNTSNLKETIRKIANLDKNQYIRVDNGRILLKIYLN